MKGDSNDNSTSNASTCVDHSLLSWYAGDNVNTHVMNYTDVVSIKSHSVIDWWWLRDRYSTHNVECASNFDLTEYYY